MCYNFFYGTGLDTLIHRKSGARVCDTKSVLVVNRRNLVKNKARINKKFIIECLKESRGVIIEGGTGCGKTTEIPKIIADGLRIRGTIACTQPRKIAAVSVASRVTKRTKNRMEIGYSVRFDKKRGKDIKYMTEGILLKEIRNDMHLMNYSVIVLDEVHEKNIETLLLIRYLTFLIKKRDDFYLVLMSATIDKEILEETDMFPIVRIENKAKNVDVKYLEYIPDDYIDEVVIKVKEIINNTKTGNIMVFLTGMEDIQVCYSKLKEFLTIDVFILHSSVSMKDQMFILNSVNRKCIVCTNIAESSITVPGIQFVIDCGLYKEMFYDPEKNTYKMITVPIQKSMAEQRAGRTGRTCPGMCFRMYTYKGYMSLHDSSISKIHIEDLQYYILLSLFLNLPICLTNSKRLTCGVQRLYMKNLIEKSTNGYLLSELGKQSLKYPVSSTHFLFLTAAKTFGCTYEAIIILSMIECVPDYHIYYKAMKDQSACKFTFYDSDHLLLLEIYEYLSKNNKKHQFLLKKINLVVSQLIEISEYSGAISISFSKCNAIQKALKSSHQTQTAFRKNNLYIDQVTHTEFYISNTSVLYEHQILPECIIYTTLVETKTINAHIISKVQ